MADVVKRKVEVGEYATESEVIRDGLRILIARGRAVEHWLMEQVGSAYDALKADPARVAQLNRCGRCLQPNISDRPHQFVAGYPITTQG